MALTFEGHIKELGKGDVVPCRCVEVRVSIDNMTKVIAGIDDRLLQVIVKGSW